MLPIKKKAGNARIKLKLSILYQLLIVQVDLITAINMKKNVMGKRRISERTFIKKFLWINLFESVRRYCLRMKYIFHFQIRIYIWITGTGFQFLFFINVFNKIFIFSIGNIELWLLVSKLKVVYYFKFLINCWSYMLFFLYLIKRFWL